MRARITAVVNAGFLFEIGPARIFVDAFLRLPPRLAQRLPACVRDVKAADLLLFTHEHWDHFDAELTAAVAARTGARVAGPAPVIKELKGRVPEAQLVLLEPPAAGRGAPPATQSVDLSCGRVTAFRTFHGRAHNSCLVESHGFRFFHDGDNEDMRRTPPLGRVDALLLGPWWGSGWVEFVERVAPERWFLIHLSEEELAQHAAGKYLPELCDHVPLPERLVVLRPGEEYAWPCKDEG